VLKLGLNLKPLVVGWVWTTPCSDEKMSAVETGVSTSVCQKDADEAWSFTAKKQRVSLVVN
jgi:hypothetical protein